MQTNDKNELLSTTAISSDDSFAVLSIPMKAKTKSSISV
jgi:hypothetical protein